MVTPPSPRRATWQRARTPEQIEQRRVAILAAADRLFADASYDDVSLGAIADEVGISKSNLYRYFESKEQIFLELYLEDVADWTEAITAALGRCRKLDDAETFSRVWVGTLGEHERLIALNSLLAGVLERRASVEAAAEFKLRLMGCVDRVRDAVARVLPSLPRARVFPLIRSAHALAAGFWPMAHPAPVMDRVMLRPEFEEFRFDFAREFSIALRALVQGSLPRA